MYTNTKQRATKCALPIRVKDKRVGEEAILTFCPFQNLLGCD